MNPWPSGVISKFGMIRPSVEVGRAASQRSPTVQATRINTILLGSLEVDLEPDAVRRRGVDSPTIRHLLDENQPPPSGSVSGLLEDPREVEASAGIDDRYVNRIDVHVDVEGDRVPLLEPSVADGIRDEFARQQFRLGEPVGARVGRRSHRAHDAARPQQLRVALGAPAAARSLLFFVAYPMHQAAKPFARRPTLPSLPRMLEEDGTRTGLSGGPGGA